MGRRPRQRLTDMQQIGRRRPTQPEFLAKEGNRERFLPQKDLNTRLRNAPMRVSTALICSSLLALSLAAPRSAGAGGPPAKFASFALCDQARLSATHPDFIATHFDFVEDGGWADPQAMKGLNQNIKLYIYFNSMYTVITRTSMPADAYFYDPSSGLKLTFPSEPTVRFMNLSSSTYRSYALQRMQVSLAKGYDGVHLDDVHGDITGPLHGHMVQVNNSGNLIPYTSVPAWAFQYPAQMTDFIAFIKRNVGPQKPVVFNGLIPPEYTETKYLPFADGFVIEGFVVDNRQFIRKHWFTDDAWVNAVNALMQNSQIKIASVMVYGLPTTITQRLYALGSYLIGNRTGLASFAYGDVACSQINFFPEWQINYGTPIDPPQKGNTVSVADYYDSAHRLYKRSFTNADIYVNPSGNDPSSVVVLPVTKYKVSLSGGNITELGGDGAITYVQIKSLQLGPHEAAILLDKPLPPPAPQGTL